jgi:hypothetical protein
MKVLAFELNEVEYLQRMGAGIDADNEVASVTGTMTIDIIKPKPDQFWITIHLPNGEELELRGHSAQFV